MLYVSINSSRTIESYLKESDFYLGCHVLNSVLGNKALNTDGTFSFTEQNVSEIIKLFTAQFYDDDYPPQMRNEVYNLISKFKRTPINYAEVVVSIIGFNERRSLLKLQEQEKRTSQVVWC